MCAKDGGLAMIASQTKGVFWPIICKLMTSFSSSVTLMQARQKLSNISANWSLLLPTSPLFKVSIVGIRPGFLPWTSLARQDYHRPRRIRGPKLSRQSFWTLGGWLCGLCGHTLSDSSPISKMVLENGGVSNCLIKIILGDLGCYLWEGNETVQNKREIYPRYLWMSPRLPITITTMFNVGLSNSEASVASDDARESLPLSFRLITG